MKSLIRLNDSRKNSEVANGNVKIILRSLALLLRKAVQLPKHMHPCWRLWLRIYSPEGERRSKKCRGFLLNTPVTQTVPIWGTFKLHSPTPTMKKFISSPELETNCFGFQSSDIKNMTDTGTRLFSYGPLLAMLVVEGTVNVDFHNQSWFYCWYSEWGVPSAAGMMAFEYIALSSQSRRRIKKYQFGKSAWSQYPSFNWVRQNSPSQLISVGASQTLSYKLCSKLCKVELWYAAQNILHEHS